ncbi:uncharacterized protein Dwil_GK11022 [Drosophila willistoni]|uniref:Drosulfakinins n=1 Tax=Drosophila willistoni TaxID=7260 RepID=B4N8I9_DROWI|nr:drosulfakinins [Drosophila willistoni]EDW81440.1 uncharacterized protein Dwil_GK11022 [Drosophila willistoni]
MSHRRCNICALALPLFVFIFYFLMVVPTPCKSASLEVGKQEQQLQDLETKMDTGAGPSDGDTFGISTGRFENRRNQRSIGFGPKSMKISRSRIPIELDFLLDNDDERLKSKRFDDYGHMRFGKRGGGEDQFDDYGHMRFGR